MKYEIASVTIQQETNELNYEWMQECTENKTYLLPS